MDQIPYGCTGKTETQSPKYEQNNNDRPKHNFFNLLYLHYNRQVAYYCNI